MERPRDLSGTPFLPLHSPAWRSALATLLTAIAGCAHGVPACLDPPPLPSGVVSHVLETTYPVSGRSVEALEAALGAESPYWEGEHVYGLARWRVSWTYHPRPHGGHCDLDRVRVILAVEVTLPEWTSAGTASPELAAAWEDFATGVRAHEYGHRDRAFLAAETVHGALAGLRDRDCGRLALLAETRANAALAHHVALDREYDRRTRRGAAQGAVWPPGAGD